MEEFQKIRDRGYAVDDEEYVVGLICIAAPIFDYHGKPVAAISVSSPKYRYDAGRHLALYSGLVTAAAQNISNKLGYKSV
jgi:DNA-binding IclR family transcriptional regulator